MYLRENMYLEMPRKPSTKISIMDKKHMSKQELRDTSTT
jgi:hypothetical protein